MTTCAMPVWVRVPLPKKPGLQKNDYQTRLCSRKTYGERYCFQHRGKKA